MNVFRLCILVVWVAAVVASSTGHAAVFSVVNTDDAGPGSLRQALIDADANMEADTIDLSAIAGQTIALISGELVIDSDQVTINGFDVTVDAQGNSRVFSFVTSDVVINDLVITGGFADSGGGILVGSNSLVLDNCKVTSNESTGIGGGIAAIDVDLDIVDTLIGSNRAGAGAGGLFLFAVSEFNMLRSQVVDNQVVLSRVSPDPAGELFGQFGQAAPATLEPFYSRGLGEGEGGGMTIVTELTQIEQSTIARNAAATAGGGALIVSTAIRGPAFRAIAIVESTISGNTAQSVAGIQASADDAVRLVNSTVANNIASERVGGMALIAGPGGSAGAIFSTISNNAAGIEGGGLLLSPIDSMVNVLGTVIAENSAPVDADLQVFDAPMAQPVRVEQSLLGSDPSTGVLNKDATSIALTGVAPQLAPLGPYGGPTLTQGPVAGSPLIDVVPLGLIGCGTIEVIDQRGEPRPQQAACDIGAVEGAVEALPEPTAVPTLRSWGLILLAMAVLWIGVIGSVGRVRQ